ncbi:anaphase-promoting complex subunit 1 isoform X2 [Coccinella septempunctata]|uniref:anaphase-promoting complex subunit 1 isoform X2 n=1 Tax=Coccinella septempunctata TaxID=41139 RepID=UPI001D079C9F|nr:anaphase-promoting complex subunit 1 isoform X2 [Coccinella septempunctata]
MISAANSEEFVPSGRRVVEDHPGPYKKLLLGDYYFEDSNNSNIEKDVCEIYRQAYYPESSSENYSIHSDPIDYVPSDRESPEPTSRERADARIIYMLDMISLADKRESQKEFWMLRNPLILDDSTISKSLPSNVLSNHFQQNGSKSIYGDSLNFRMSVSNRSKLKKRFSTGSENLSSSSKFSPSLNEKSSKSILAVENTSKNKSTKLNTKLRAGYVEDELYVKGYTVVWSRSIVNTYGSLLEPLKKIICSYRCEDKILCIQWCTFRSERPTYNTAVNEMNPDYKSIEVPSICVVSNQTIKVFAESGEDFEVAVPFPIEKVWAVDFGIIICRKVTDGDSKDVPIGAKSTLYSLAHPLDDIYPVVMSKGSYSQILSNPDVKVIFTSESPSLCVLYDYEAKQHFAYRIRKCRPEEKDFYEKSLGLNSSSTVNNSLKLKNRLSMWDNVSGNVPSILNSVGRINSFSNLHTHSKTHSPTVSSVRSHSAFGSTATNYDLSQPSSTYNLDKAMSLDMSRSLLPIKQFPAICLDHVWTEPSMEGENARASKVFVCDDLAGQSYFCYVSQLRLFMVKANFTNGSNFMFGASTSISAKDAVPIPHLHMLAILEHSGNVSLYSGMTLVGKLHLDGTLVKHTPTPYLRRFQTQLNSSFPRRSSLLPHCKQADPEFDEQLFSPVLPSDRPNMHQVSMPPQGNVSVEGLRDPLENRITLIYSDKTFYRVKFPLLATSPLVEHCLNALWHCLQRDAVMTLFTRWYTTRNGLGTQDCTDQQEWEMFTTLLFELLGYEEEQNDTSKDDPQTPSASAKKARPSFVGSDDDWNHLINSEYNKVNAKQLSTLLRFHDNDEPSSLEDSPEQIKINTNSVLFPYIKLIHFSLHLMYEDFKLDKLLTSLLRPLAIFLNQICNDMSMFEYSLHYWKDFPEWCKVGPGNRRFVNESRQFNLHNVGFEGVVNIMEYLSYLLQGCALTEFPYLKNVNERSRDIVQLCNILSGYIHNVNRQGNVMKPLNEISSDIPFNKTTCKSLEEIVLLMTQMNITTQVLNTLPFGLYLFFYDALWKCRENPPTDWPTEAYLLIQREDLAYISNLSNKVDEEPSFIQSIVSSMEMSIPTAPELAAKDGMDNIDCDITNLIFPDDMRIDETRNMLQSSRPVEIAIVQRPDISDHDFIEEQEKHLFAVCTRTMALPVGRGMFALQTTVPLMIQPVHAPQLCLTGRGAPRGTTIELSHIDAPSNMNLWPLFHNGVATGLTISPNSNIIDRYWIVFNKPKTSDKDMEYGGFLLAMGLHGHLKRLDVWNIYQHLSKKHEMITVGLLLGFASAHRGTCHMAVTKMLSIHLEALLPPTSMELDLTHAPQVTSLLGIGLLYQGTAHSHMAEVLLSEIGRPPGPEMENSTDRESYALAAGLGLGLVMLQRGGKSGSQDMNTSDMLHYYMTGGIKRPFTGAQKDKYKVPSFQIREGASVNLDVTAPGATLALGLMYFGSMNKTIADWMSPPETQYLLDFIRPDFLMLRIISKSLILWDDIRPTRDWIENQVPKSIRPYCMVQPSASSGEVDYEAMNQAYCNIIAGACFSMGLRYAGTANEEAFRSLLHFCHMFVSLTGKSISELAGKTTIETCLNVLLLSISMVMAGTGNLDIMRLIRHLRRRVGVSSSAIVTYGSHLAIHMALGLLFLGGGKFTLSNSPASVAALICAFYPKFPTHSNDNRYHLQAFRHLYVLAVETRLIIPRDLYTGKSCYANLKIVQMDGTSYNVKAPTTLPNLNDLREVSVDDERYWKIVFKKDLNWKTLEIIISSDGILEVKQRAGCQSYLQDKLDHHSQFARMLSQSNITPWNPSPYTIKNFTSNEGLKLFCVNFLEPCDCSEGERQIKNFLTRVTYEAAVRDKLVIIPAYTAIVKMILSSSLIPNNFQLWQFKLLMAHVESFIDFNILPNHLLDSIKEEVELKMEYWGDDMSTDLQKYMGGRLEELNHQSIARSIAAFANLFDVPHDLNRRTVLTLLQLTEKTQMQQMQ